MNQYFTGNAVRCSFTLSPAVDPTTVIFRYKKSNGDKTAYTYGVNAELVKSAVGSYYVDLVASGEGQWHYRLETTTPNAAIEATFTVLKTQF